MFGRPGADAPPRLHPHLQPPRIAVTSQAAVAEPDVATVEEVTPETRRDSKAENKRKKQPRYHVILWNDDDHTYEYVITMLQKLFGYPIEQGYLLAKEVDAQGKVIVLTTALEHAELKRDQILAYGKDVLIAACKGSMSASIEPAPE
jgi:ATP-dependent Clp protease adaptor protein ClpS